MAIANVAQSIASQQEWVRPQLEDLSLVSSKLWKRVEKNTKIHPVSNRPFRIPTMPVQGGKFRTGNNLLDGADLGVGSGPVQVPGTGTCVAYVQASSYTALAEYATDEDEKAIENFADLTHRYAAKTFGGYMDMLMQTAGDNALDTIVSVGTNSVVVNNANLFQNNQDVDIWTAVNGAFVNTYTILTADAVTATLTFTANLSGVSAGYKILVNGAAGQSNTGLNGIRTFAVSTNTGTWMNVPRSSYPGLYTKPTLTVNGSLTPAIVREIQSLIELAKGVEEENETLIGHCNVDVRNSWENNALLVQHVEFNNQKGDRTENMLKKKAPDAIGGYEMVVNERALPGYLDLIPLKNWSRVETKPIDFYSVAGQTLFPIYGASGGLTTGLVFYLVWMGQTFEVNTRDGAFLSGISIQKGLFGR